ncbi:MAG: BMP family ABC transporter substrate-binding protein [Bdellovibrionaceae bacterium]|nr:BMP family ABC transporter substrate-binding protein [Pseudobdellovibrionaceae bacterium]
MILFLRRASFIALWVFALNTFANDPIKVGLVLDKGGRDDKSFNSAAFEGAMKAQKEMGISLKYVEATDLNALENLHRSFARKNFDLIIGIGFAQTDAVKKISAQFPSIKFALVDGEIQAPNVRSLLFEEHEGSFVVGAIAALTSKTGRIGFIGGMDIPLIRRFAMGYQAGIKYINPKATVLENYIGVSGDAWSNPAKAKELGLSQFGQKVDIIFVAAGASNAGVFDAAEEKKAFAIGVDSNQNWVKPGFILTSMLKRVDVAVFETIKQVQDGHFAGGISRFGLKDKGVDYSLDKYNEKLLKPDVQTKVNEIKKKIVAGEIQVPDYYKLKK